MVNRVEGDRTPPIHVLREEAILTVEDIFIIKPELQWVVICVHCGFCHQVSPVFKGVPVPDHAQEHVVKMAIRIHLGGYEKHELLSIRNRRTYDQGRQQAH